MRATEVLRLGAVLLGVVLSAGCEPSPTAATAKPENIVIAVDKDGNLYWNDEPITCVEMMAKMAAKAVKPVDAPKVDYCERFDRGVADAKALTPSDGTVPQGNNFP